MNEMQQLGSSMNFTMNINIIYGGKSSVGVGDLVGKKGLIEGSQVRFPVVAIHRRPRQASHPMLPLCVIVECD